MKMITSMAFLNEKLGFGFRLLEIKKDERRNRQNFNEILYRRKKWVSVFDSDLQNGNY